MRLQTSPRPDGVSCFQAAGRRHHRPDGCATFETFLEALGVDWQAPGLARTPERVAEIMSELLTAPALGATTSPNDAGYDEMVLVGDFSFTSLCERHLLPFRGVAYVAYLPREGS